MTARPLTKPNMTLSGTRRMYLAHLKMPTMIWITPASATAAKAYSSPCVLIRAINVTTVAPAPPEINPGRPPNRAATSPAMNAAYSPESGGKPARMANDNDSGIMVMATAKPAKISARHWIGLSRSKKFNTFPSMRLTPYENGFPLLPDPNGSGARISRIQRKNPGFGCSSDCPAPRASIHGSTPMADESRTNDCSLLHLLVTKLWQPVAQRPPLKNHLPASPEQVYPYGGLAKQHSPRPL